ncbi:MAG: hypothetical protein ACI8TL_000253 [Natronomonas sp.]|jgi:hypothetical protein
MNPRRVLGIALAVVGLAGYVGGVAVAYPGRAFSITLLMFGIALAAISSSPTGESV